MRTKVINIEDAPKAWRYNPDYVYIGRGSKWGNPFIIGRDGNREEVVRKYEEYLVSNDELMGSLEELDYGKILVCFCKPLLCHGDVLVRKVNER